jgi:hypothetical protein
MRGSSTRVPRGGEPYLEKVVWQVALPLPLPSPLGLSEVVGETVQVLTRGECYIERLGKFETGYNEMIDSVKAILPKNDMKAVWASCVLTVDLRPLLTKFRTLLEESPGQPGVWVRQREMGRSRGKWQVGCQRSCACWQREYGRN